MINKEILSDTDSIYNYMDGEKVLGYLEIRLVDGVVDIMNLFVNEEDRKKGIATSLMNKMIEEENYSRIMLEVNENNVEAIRLYSKLGFKEMAEINDLLGMPLVLHGGSGIPDDQLRKAIDRGTAKINVNTESQQAWTAIVREVVKNDEKVYDPRKVIGPGKKGIANVVETKCKVFGCINKAF